MPLTFAETPLYYRDSQGQYHRILSGADMTGYRTAAAQDAIDAAQDAEIGIVITGKRPSIAVTAGQYVIVRNGTISGITDGLYTANAALSPSTDVTAANLSAVSGGGLNSVRSNAVRFANVVADSGTVGANLTVRFAKDTPQIDGYTAIGIIGVASIGTSSISSLYIDSANHKAIIDVHNYSSTTITINPIFVVLYVRN